MLSLRVELSTMTALTRKKRELKLQILFQNKISTYQHEHDLA